MFNPAQLTASSFVHSALILTPCMVAAMVKRSRALAQVAALTFALYIAQTLLLTMPNIGLLAGLQYNWLQKLLGFALCFAILKPLNLDFRQCGFSLPSDKKAIWIATLVGILFDFLATLEEGSHSQFKLEPFLFQCSIPGLQEEILVGALLYQKNDGKRC